MAASLRKSNPIRILTERSANYVRLTRSISTRPGQIMDKLLWFWPVVSDITASLVSFAEVSEKNRASLFGILVVFAGTSLLSPYCQKRYAKVCSTTNARSCYLPGCMQCSCLFVRSNSKVSIANTSLKLCLLTMMGCEGLLLYQQFLLIDWTHATSTTSWLLLVLLMTITTACCSTLKRCSCY